MRADLPSVLPLVCPACHQRTERGREMHTLSLATVLRAKDEVEEGTLVCDNPACGRRYPIIDGIPIIAADLAALLRSSIIGVLERELDPEIVALLAGAGPDDAPYTREIEHLSIYIDAHWGDCATPPPDGAVPGASFGMAQLANAVAARAGARVERAIELGCSLGRGLYELSRGAQLTIGLDRSFSSLSRARRLLSGAPLPYARRVSGRHYAGATARASEPVPPGGAVTFICGDALDPPLVPGGFDRVSALNLLDAVASPPRLLSVIDALCAPGGELLLASPYAWQSGIVAEEHRFSDADPARELRRRLVEGSALEARYAVQDEQELSWWLRRDARAATVYAVHWLRAHKPR
jgi:uncharacterized protein YbaR (Trm112 family)